MFGEVRRTVGDEWIGRAVQERETTTRTAVCRFFNVTEKIKIPSVSVCHGYRF